MSDEGPKSSEYPPPLIVEPTTAHTETWIILHGRGDSAPTFAHGTLGVLSMPLPDGRTLQDHLPHVRFVFPTASLRRARVFNHDTLTQWFDIYSWNSTEKTEWQVQGLRETTAWISELVRREAEIVGAKNVVVGGLSQGCASVLIWNLLRGKLEVKCVFGMSGWLPFRHILELHVPRAQDATRKDGEDISGRGAQEDKNEDPYKNAVKALLQELGLDPGPAESDLGKTTPIFLAHGKEDEKVDLERGQEAAMCLRGIGCNVQWVEYEHLRHWFYSAELMEIVQFVRRQGSPGSTAEAASVVTSES